MYINKCYARCVHSSDIFLRVLDRQILYKNIFYVLEKFSSHTYLTYSNNDTV